MAAAAEAANTVTACCFNWRYAPAYQTAQKAIRSGQIGAIRDMRTEGYFRARSQFFLDRPWIAGLDIANGTLAEGLSHDFDKARYLSGEEFVTVISRITPVTPKPDGDFFVNGGRSMHLAELSGGILAQFCLAITVGEDRFSGSSSAMRDQSASPTPEQPSCGSDTTTMSRSNWRSPAPTATSTDLQQHTWNRLIADFIGAVRDDDKDHESYPSLPTLTDGLRTEEVISAARRSSSAERWATVGE
jgi:predicted dehydrogenase